MPEHARTPLAATLKDLARSYTVQIVVRLKALRLSCGLSACPPPPDIAPNEIFLGLSIYTGPLEDITTHDNRNFGDLGRLFFLVDQRVDDVSVKQRFIFNNERIPRHILQADEELNRLLDLRNACLTSPPTSLPLESNTEAATRDAETDVSDSGSLSSQDLRSRRAERKHAPYVVPNRRLVQRIMIEVTVTLIVWSTGDCMTLSMVAGALDELFQAHTDTASLERFVLQKGWMPILYDTPFVVNEGDIISLKYSSTEVNNWHIHVAHLY
ncbi:hypothetical protein F5878DRAFT_667972 [Lentinula raphanica]|uniref:Uncharacterized protein n=1 Tax=Lentinula raphanica TaxID=153919 RepID=A0AA38NUV9_9AGAR|nr:hypothetical protein F5878DRAFT_667972 [Lentinula raphanica]